MITAATLAVTVTVYDAKQWAGYAAANLHSWRPSTSLIGVIIGPLLGKVARSVRRFPDPVS